MIDDSLREELSALIDGALPEGRAAELRRRIGVDAELRREYEELERAVVAVRALPRSRAPAALRERVRASVAPRSRVLRLGGLALAATVLLAAGLVLYLRREPPVKFEAKRDRTSPPAEKTFGESPLEEARSQTRDEQKLGKDGPGTELPEASGAKETKKRGARTKQEQEDLLVVVARTRALAEDDRAAYLRSVSALGAEKALEHIRAVFPEERQLAEARSDTTPVLATIQLATKEEANLVKGILDAVPRTETGAAALRMEQQEKDEISTEVEASPADLARLARWLELLDVARAKTTRPRVAVLGAAKADDEAQAKSRVAVVRLRYGKPPPEPEAPANGK